MFFGNAIVDFAGEILLDPSNWVQWGAASVEKQFTEAVDQYMSLEQLAVKPDAGLRYEFLSKLDKIDRMRLGQYLLEHHTNLSKMERCP